MDRKKRKPGKSVDLVNEPYSVYPDIKDADKLWRTITISSLEEQDDDNYYYWLSLTPEQRLELHYNMINHNFQDQLRKNKKTSMNKIIFDQ